MSLWIRLRAALAAALQRWRNYMGFRRRALGAASDGRLTSAEERALSKFTQELDITEADLRRVGLDAYAVAYKRATSDGHVTAEEEAELERIQSYFGVADTSVRKTKLALARYRLLREIGEGHLPAVEAHGLALQRGEVPHWEEPAKLLEERVLRRERVGSSRGVSVRMARGITLRVGAQRGRTVVTTGIVPVSTGSLVVTSKRIVFRGDQKGFSIKLDKVLDVELLKDGLQVLDGNGQPRVVQLESMRDADILGSILSQVIANTNS